MRQEGENLTALLVWIDKEPLKGSVLFVVPPLHIPTPQHNKQNCTCGPAHIHLASQCNPAELCC